MTSPAPPRSLAPWYLLGVLTLAYTFSFIDRQILNLLVAPIRRDLDLTDFDISLLQGFAFAIFYTLLGIPLGRLADRTDRRRLVAAGIALWSIMTVLCGVARTYGQLFVARIGVGVGEAALSPAAYSLIADSFPKERLGRAASTYNFGVHFGSALALIAGGAIVQRVSDPGLIELPLIGPIQRWQIVFWAVGLPGLLVALLALTIREPARAPRTGTDRPSFRAVLAHVATYRGFYVAHFLGFSLCSLVAYGVGAWAPTLMMRTYGWPPARAGLAYGLISLVCGPAGVFAGGWVSDRLWKQGRTDATLRTAMYGALALLPFAVIAPLMPTGGLAIAMAVPVTFLFAFPFGVAAAAIQLVAGAEIRAQITAIYLFFGTLIGLGAGPTVIALVTQHVFGADDQLHYAAALVAGVVTPLAVLAFRSGLAPLRRMVGTDAAH